MRDRVRRVLRNSGRQVWTLLAAAVLTAPALGQPVGNDVVLAHRGGVYTSTVVVGPAPEASTVEVELWRSDEGPPLELTERVEAATVWPDSFTLARGETQLVRIAVPDTSAGPGDLLRVETTVTPFEPAATDYRGTATMRVVLRTRFITKLWIARRP